MDESRQNRFVDEIINAENNIRKYIRKTPLEYSNCLSTKENNIHLKLENIQHTGSFKIRGAFNKIRSLSEEQRSKGIVTASTGNHGAAIAYVLQQLGGSGTIYLPKVVSKSKLDNLKQYKMKLEFYGDDSADTEKYARKNAEENDQPYISPYNDVKIIAGQGTIGMELVQQLKQVDHCFITVGGGGLISGIAAYIKSIYPNVMIHGCLPKNSPVMYESIKAGQIISVNSKETLSDGSAGGIEQGSITFELCKKYVDEYILVSEDEIKNGIKLIFENHRQVIEGAAAVSVSSYLQKKESIAGNAVIVICGGNIDTRKFIEIVK